MRLTALPAPDQFDFDLPEGCLCLIADEGTATGIELARRLTARGWRVALLRLPGAAAVQSDLPSLLTTVSLEDWGEAHLSACLTALERDYGPVGGLIHLQPSGEGDWFAPRARSSLKWLFLLAKHLKRPLSTAAERGQSCFVAVTRLDGQLGLGQASDYSAVNGGVFGLAKTLSLEWPQVFCRAVDVSPDFTPERAAEAVVAELHDPNRLMVETAWSEQGRVTLRA